MDFFKNLTLNLKATGLSAVVIAWMICFTALALFGADDIASYALGLLGSAGVMLVIAFGKTSPK
jgi:hypothetical protein